MRPGGGGRGAWNAQTVTVHNRGVSLLKLAILKFECTSTVFSGVARILGKWPMSIVLGNYPLTEGRRANKKKREPIVHWGNAHLFPLGTILYGRRGGGALATSPPPVYAPEFCMQSCNLKWNLEIKCEDALKFFSGTAHCQMFNSRTYSERVDAYQHMIHVQLRKCLISKRYISTSATCWELDMSAQEVFCI